MNRRIDQATVQRILDTADIVDVVSDYVSLKRRGSGYIGLCPFHNERTPSFSVSPSKGICKCFSCGKGGSPVNFLMELEKMSFQEALRHLAKKYHIEIKERELTDKEREEASERESMNAVNEWALRFFETTLHDTPEGRDVGLAYFRERGLNDTIIKRFHLGYSPDKGNAIYRAATAKGYTDKYLIATGLCARSSREPYDVYDRFRARVIYPIHSVSGKVVAFGGRTLRSDKSVAKYVNSPESLVYSKSNQLYGLYQSRSAVVNRNKCYLVEGYMDVISMAQSGVENVVASSGTSLTLGQIRLLRRFTTNVTVVYDSDAAGIKASLRGIDLLLAEGMNVKVLQFPPGEDPDSYARSHSATELEQYLADNEVDFIQFKSSILMGDAKGDPMQRSVAINNIIGSIAVIPDLVQRTVYVGLCAQMFGIDEKVIALQLAKTIAANAEREKAESQRRRGHEDIDNLEKQQQSQQQAAGGAPSEGDVPPTEPPLDPHGDTATPPTPAQAPANPAFTPAASSALAPYETEVLRYILRYGLSLIDSLADDGVTPASITVLEYVESDMAFDGISFSDPAVAITFAAAQRLVAERWADEYAAFSADLQRETLEMRRRGDEDIRSRLDTIKSLDVEEKALDERIKAHAAEADDRFRSAFLQHHLLSSDNDVIRNLTTSLVADRYRLSNVHFRFGNIATERDRLSSLVEQAVYGWKFAILQERINDLNRLISALSAAPSPDYDAIRQAMADKAELTAVKCQFARALGERVYTPK